MPFKKGQSGNPKGRPKGSYKINHLEKALEKAAKERNTTFLDHVAQQAMEDRAVLMKVLDKIIPNLKQVDKTVDSNVTGTVSLAWKKSSK